MYKIHFLSALFLFYSCGNETPNSPSIDYYPDDQEFIDKLIELNDITVEDLGDDIIKNVKIDSGNVNYYKIEKLYLGNMGLDSISNLITNLDSLKILYLNNNHIKYFPSGICNFINQLDSLDVTNNLLCNPQVPTCIIDLETTMSVFYATQNDCEYQMSVTDKDFIKSIIFENWSVSETDAEYDSLWTLLNNEEKTIWQEFIEEDEINERTIVVSRIVQIKYEGFNRTDEDIHVIPPNIQRVDSLKFLYLSNNNLGTIPPEIGYLTRLKYLHLDNNEIKIVPENYGGDDGGLRKLEKLIIHDNKIDTVSSNLSNLISLTELDLSRNSLEHLPQSLCDISSIIKIVGNHFGCGCAVNPDYNICFDSNVIDQFCENCE